MGGVGHKVSFSFKGMLYGCHADFIYLDNDFNKTYHALTIKKKPATQAMRGT